MLSNAYFFAKIGADTAENEQHFAEILPKLGNYPTDLLQTSSKTGSSIPNMLRDFCEAARSPAQA